jgi:hypothetical protein
MDKYKDFPELPRRMTDDEGEQYLRNMVKQIEEFEPDEIVAVARSGFSYAMWVAQILKLPLGAYWPKEGNMITTNNPKKIVFVDDNILQGSTYLETKKLMAEHLPDMQFRWAVLFSDWHTPEAVRDEIIQGIRLPYFAEEPMWGSRKVSVDYGIRYRDEQDSI